MRTKLKITIKCIGCGVTFNRTNNRGHVVTRRKYCSRSCSSTHTSKKEKFSKIQKMHKPAGLGHHSEKIWRFKDPRRISHSFKNLREFVRVNYHLFTDEEFSQKEYFNIYSGLCALSPRRKIVAGSYRGWTWNSITERIEE